MSIKVDLLCSSVLIAFCCIWVSFLIVRAASYLSARGRWVISSGEEVLMDRWRRLDPSTPQRLLSVMRRMMMMMLLLLSNRQSICDRIWSAKAHVIYLEPAIHSMAAADDAFLPYRISLSFFRSFVYWLWRYYYYCVYTGGGWGIESRYIAPTYYSAPSQWLFHIPNRSTQKCQTREQEEEYRYCHRAPCGVWLKCDWKFQSARLFLDPYFILFPGTCTTQQLHYVRRPTTYVRM